MAPTQPLVLHYRGPSPNPWKVAIILEELGLPWKFSPVQDSELKTEPFISLNPNGQVPVVEDPNTGIVLWEVSRLVNLIPWHHLICSTG
jgi:glutathione S-transferase